MSYQCTLSIDVGNLNMTADQVMRKNAFARVQKNPIKKIFSDLIEPARKILLEKTFQQLKSDVANNVMYFCDGTAGMGVFFCFEIVSGDNRSVNATHVTIQDKGDQYLYKETIEIDSEEKAGLTFRVLYYVYLKDSGAATTPNSFADR